MLHSTWKDQQKNDYQEALLLWAKFSTNIDMGDIYNKMESMTIHQANIFLKSKLEQCIKYKIKFEKLLDFVSEPRLMKQKSKKNRQKSRKSRKSHKKSKFKSLVS